MSLSAWRAACAADLRANAGYPKSRFVLVLFRTAHALRESPAPWARGAYLAFGTLYKVLSEWILGIELPASTSVGPGLRLRHGVGLVVNPHSVIGADVMLRHGVTIGNRRSETDCPVIEDGVECGAGAVIIGAVTVGAGSRIGAGAVVVKDVPAGSVVINRGTVVLAPGERAAAALSEAERPDPAGPAGPRTAGESGR